MLIDFSTLGEYYVMGGFVMPPLVVASFLLWYGLASRYISLQNTKRDPRHLVNRAFEDKFSDGVLGDAAKNGLNYFQITSSREELKAKLDEEYRDIVIEISKHRVMVKTLVAVAPLLGLLGTVDGMMETFDSLGDMALFSSTGGIAGGISKALFTTQIGLVVSIPGLLIGRILDRRESNISRELDQMKDIYCSRKDNP